MDKESSLSKFLKRMAGRRKLGKRGFTPKAYTQAPKVIPKAIPKAFRRAFDGSGVDTTRAWQGYRHQAMKGGDESLLMWPIRAAAEKLIGGHKGIRKVRGGAWKHVSSKALNADIAVGEKLQKIPLVGKSMFTLKEDIPWGKGMKKEVHRPSMMAPLIKTRDLAEPILVGVGLEKGIKTLSGKKHQGQNMEDQNLREKVASVMLSLQERNKEHEKRAHALKLLYKKAELGFELLPQTHSELEVKLASLVNEDLVVLEKALELAGGTMKLGELGREDTKANLNSAEKFQASILGDEF